MKTPKCKQCRREGEKLFLKGSRCEGQKCAITRRNYAPGQVGKSRFSKQTEYGRHLRAKQKARRIYGISETQFRLYYTKADKSKETTGPALLTILETRLDNVIYRAGMAESRTQARQIVTHGHIKLNGRRVDIPSIQVKVGDKFEARAASKKHPALKKAAENKKFKSPKWLKVDLGNLSGEILAMPGKDDAESSIDTQLIVEFYSK
ncbi:MAG: 30S ribosomal protein S4 [Patescibacteria group bacterium]|nr:30S ribosomal protein S4 [Patescibacteria group bacterium]